MISPGQICRDLTCKTFKIVIVLGPSLLVPGKLRACRWHSSDEPSGGHWTPPRQMLERDLEPLAPDFDLTSRRGQGVSAAKRAIVDGSVRWQITKRRNGTTERYTSAANVGTVRP